MQCKHTDIKSCLSYVGMDVAIKRAYIKRLPLEIPNISAPDERYRQMNDIDPRLPTLNDITACSHAYRNFFATCQSSIY